jgi:hypothetical protein
MFWFLYILSVTLVAHHIALLRRNNYLFILFTLLCLLLTPSQIELSSTKYVPALFSFIFNVFIRARTFQQGL